MAGVAGTAQATPGLCRELRERPPSPSPTILALAVAFNLWITALNRAVSSPMPLFLTPQSRQWKRASPARTLARVLFEADDALTCRPPQALRITHPVFTLSARGERTYSGLQRTYARERPFAALSTRAAHPASPSAAAMLERTEAGSDRSDEGEPCSSSLPAPRTRRES